MNNQEQTRKHNVSSYLPRILQKLPLRRSNAGVDLGVEKKIDPGIDPALDFGIDFGVDFGIHFGVDFGVDSTIGGGVRNPYFFK